MSLGEICLKTNIELREQIRLADGALAQAEQDLAGAYTERAHLLALLGAIYPSHLFLPDDASENFPCAVCIHFPWGQGTWHLAKHDVHLFPKTEVTPSDWDGEGTESKYQGIEHAIAYGNTGAHCYMCGEEW